jgi:DNA-binding transcriptional ArsR family regulator
MAEQLAARRSKGEPYSPDATFSALARSERRRLLRCLVDAAPEPDTEEELATALAAFTRDKSQEAVAEEERGEAAVRLHHKHLPSLTAAGFVQREADGAIRLAEHPALGDSGILKAIEGEAIGTAASLDALFRALADTRRRSILDVLSHQVGAIHVETLARELEAKKRDVPDSDVLAADVPRSLTRLRHVDLPHLSKAGLVEYDPDDRTIAYSGHPDLRVPWMHSVFEPEFRESLTGESHADGIGEIEGRERVISFGQALCDRADEELFCTFTDTELLEAGCLTRIRDASRERDVDIYLGTRDPTVRAYVEENAPEVLLWEPNTDWLTLPVAGDRVDRLLLADREAVMLGTLLGPSAEGTHREQSIVGEGEHNPLVTMICQLLDPHLEEIDEGTDDTASRLPL